ncbi:MAG: hypothetical protein HWE27_04895 [Gammaproteobacteria bacterium]|nr:hypothetical protein [Gammaproteobacteria bacterium]
MNSTDPYKAPNSDQEPRDNSTGQERQLRLMAPRKVLLGRSVSWLIEGFDYFKKSPGPWMLTIVVGFCIFLMMSTLTVLGFVVSNLLTYVWVGGLMLGCHAQYQGKTFAVQYLFAGFKKQFQTLVTLSLVMGVLNFIVMYLVIGPIYWDLVVGSANPSPEAKALMENPIALSETLIWGFVATLPLLMMSLFAPTLIVMHNVSVLKAMQYSFLGCSANIFTLLIFGILISLLYVVALIPLALGLLVLIPTVISALFIAYKDIFTSPHVINDHMEV